MKCPEVRKRLRAYRDSEVPDDQKALISQHLESCADCRLELDKLTRLSNELALLVDVPVRPYFMTRVRQRIADQQAESFRARRVPAWVRRVAIPAGAIAVVILASQIGGLLGRTMYVQRMRDASLSMTGTAGRSGLDLLDAMSASSLAGVCDSIFPGGDIE